MQQPGVKPDRKVRLSRGVPVRRSEADEAAFLDGATAAEGHASVRDWDEAEAVSNDNGIAAHVGNEPAPRGPPGPAIYRLPALRATAIAAVSRAAALSVAVLRHAGAVFNPAGRHSEVAARKEGLKAYLVLSLENQRRAGGRVLALALIVGGSWASLMPLSGAVVVPGTVVSASGTVVSASDEVQIDARLPPDQIERVHDGQNAQIRFPALNQRTAPELAGIVSHVPADITGDQRQSSGPGFYTVRVSLPGREFGRLRDRKPVAGMPAEVFIQTGSRTLISYLFEPITDQFQRMFRER
jgi:HlyD family secretion protein